jgi:hypothetical protein
VSGEKEAACLRLCGDSATRGIHFQGCPILRDIWLGKKRPTQKFQNLESGEKKP